MDWERRPGRQEAGLRRSALRDPDAQRKWGTGKVGLGRWDRREGGRASTLQLEQTRGSNRGEQVEWLIDGDARSARLPGEAGRTVGSTLLIFVQARARRGAA